MVYTGISMETIIISVMVSIMFLLAGIWSLVYELFCNII